MPIQGLSEKARLPRLGKIHLGVKTVNEKGTEYPKAVDYFVCPPEVQKVFGERPKEFRVIIPVEDEEKWCSQYYRAYSRSRGLICKGDGFKAMALIDSTTGTFANKDSKAVVLKEIICEGRKCAEYNKQCREVMNLQFLLPEVPGLGIWQIDTGSINSIRNINDGAAMVKAVYGRISMIPLKLTIEAKEVQIPNGPKKTIHVLHLRSDMTLMEMTQAALAPKDKLLTAGGDAFIPGEWSELPVPDDEEPELIMPQNQEPKVIELPKETINPPVTTRFEKPKVTEKTPDINQKRQDLLKALNAKWPVHGTPAKIKENQAVRTKFLLDNTGCELQDLNEAGIDKALEALNPKAPEAKQEKMV